MLPTAISGPWGVLATPIIRSPVRRGNAVTEVCGVTDTTHQQASGGRRFTPHRQPINLALVTAMPWNHPCRSDSDVMATPAINLFTA